MKAKSSVDAISGKMYFSRIQEIVVDRRVLVLQGGSFNLGEPHSALFIIKDSTEKFAKGPSVGISPYSLLKDTFRYFRYTNPSNDLGISPDRALSDRSMNSKLFKLLNECNMGPSNLL